MTIDPRPFQQIDLPNFPTDRDLQRASAYAYGWPAHINQGDPLWDPRDPFNQANSRIRRDGSRRSGLVNAGTLHLLDPSSDISMTTRNALQAFQTFDPLMASRCFVEIQLHTVRLQVTETSQIRWPDSFDPSWWLTVAPNEYADQVEAWEPIDVVPWDGIMYLGEVTDPLFTWGQRSGNQWRPYAACPNLANRDCQDWLLDRVEAILTPLGVTRFSLGTKLTQLTEPGHIEVPPGSTTSGPWLPNPYGIGEYALGCGDLLRKAGERWGPENVTLAETSGATVTDYLGAFPSEFYGWAENRWSIAHLVERGFDERYL